MKRKILLAMSLILSVQLSYSADNKLSVSFGGLIADLFGVDQRAVQSAPKVPEKKADVAPCVRDDNSDDDMYLFYSDDDLALTFGGSFEQFEQACAEGSLQDINNARKQAFPGCLELSNDQLEKVRQEVVASLGEEDIMFDPERSLLYTTCILPIQKKAQQKRQASKAQKGIEKQNKTQKTPLHKLFDFVVGDEE